MSDVLLLETANVFIGKHDPSKSKHLVVQNLTLPGVDFVTVEHQAGGAPMGVKWNMGSIKPLEPKFKLAGFDREAYRAAAIGSGRVETITMRGSIRRKSDGAELECVAKFRGSLGTMTPDEFGPSKEMGHDHMLADVTYYRLVIGGEEWFLVDFFRAVVRRFGIDEWATRRQYLGLA